MSEPVSAELQTQSEQGEILNEAVPWISTLFVNERTASVLGGKYQEDQDVRWTEAATEFPTLADKIQQIKQMLRLAEADRRVYSPQVFDNFKFPFLRVEDLVASEYLKDVLAARMTIQPGQLDFDKKPTTEANNMAAEMGLTEGWFSEAARKVTGFDAIRATLTGALKIAH
jgi:hypothetical protein